MGKTQRIKTEVGINKQINVKFEQDFDFLEILSLKIQQEDVYTKSCSEYGVVVGRVTANNGFGIPNARVSVFIPITEQDKSNPEIFSIYPYTSPDEKNEDGYRYNLLPYQQSHSGHVPTGTFPSRDDVMNDRMAIEIYDKYYKYTVKTNESGDYLIMGVPLGVQQVLVDLDLSDIGDFSLTPQDLIRMGKATEAQVSGSRFKSSNDLNSLPQIVSITKSIDVAPFWGDPEICQIAISRVDFDLRDDANIDIQPTSVFLGSMISTTEKFRVRKNGKPKDNMGNLCSLVTGPGQILAIRQTINLDNSGRPILEQYQLEKSGNVIDESGSWLVELPMNLDYVVTNEFGDKVTSDDPTVGIPTKARYRFKIKWSQPPTLTQQVRRPYYLVPNIKEYGWTNTTTDPNTQSNYATNKDLTSSYYFGLDWSGYGDTGTTLGNQMINEAIDCKDRFYEFEFNRVYTISSFIDQYKSGSRGRFIGIKEIDDDACATTVNRFPVNDGFRNFDFLYFIFALIFQVIQLIGIPILIVFHFLAFLWNNFAVPILAFLVFTFARNAVQEFAAMSGAIAGSAAFGATVGLIIPFLLKGLLWTAASILLVINFRKITKYKFQRFKVPMIQYPDCSTCECQTEETGEDTSLQGNETPRPGLLSQVSSGGLYVDELIKYEKQKGWWFDPAIPTTDREDYYNIFAIMKSSAIAGWASKPSNPNEFKINATRGANIFPNNIRQLSYGVSLPPGERINLFNTRKKYFDGENRIRVTFDYQSNQGKLHYDNTITILSAIDLEPGTVLSFIAPTKSKDPNFLWSGTTGNTELYGIEGTSVTGPSIIQVTYASPSSQITQNTVSYNISTGTTETRNKYPGDIEYYQVLTAITLTKQVVNNVTTYTNPNFSSGNGFWGYLNQDVTIRTFDENTDCNGWSFITSYGNRQENLPITFYKNFETQKVLILQRGVDPYSPKVVNQYGIGKILGYQSEDDVVITVAAHLNIPIQPLPSNTNISVQDHRQISQVYFGSNFFTPGTTLQPFSAYSTDNVGYYGRLDNRVTPNRPEMTSFSILGSIRGVQANNWANYGNSNTGGNFGRYFNLATNDKKYYSPQEDLSGAALMQGDFWPEENNNLRGRCVINCGSYYAQFSNYNLPGNPCFANYKGNPFGGYYSKVLYPDFETNKLPITSPNQLIFRTDRLPSSDFSDNTEDNGFKENVSLLQQNLGFAVYNISTGDAIGSASDSFSLGADQVSPDIEGQFASGSVITSLNTCVNMVSLKCYSGNGYNFGIKSGCQDSDSIENGCYVFLNRPLLDLGKDLKAWGEWGFRFRFFYGLCRGVLAQSFMNNWINGTLYAFPIQVDTFFDSQNKPKLPVFVRKLVHFDVTTNNFYYRSSPYYNNNFIGRQATESGKVNNRNLLFPTTIMNLGMKDSFYDEIIFDPATNAYIFKDLDSTSFSDTSDLVNLFVITRITDENFAQQIIALGANNGLNQLFSRPEKRIDGDLAQVLSINSEFGVIPFSPEFYAVFGLPSDPVVVLGNLRKPTMGVFFSSTTVDLQNKDFVTPGVINFRVPNFPNANLFKYGIKTQEVPFYQWYLNNQSNIFGDETNNWATSISDIFSSGYQSLDRRNPNQPTYFFGTNSGQLGDVYQRGYIFNVDANGGYSINSGQFPTKFLVGAPFHFYFGLMKGNSALDKFKTKYTTDE